MKKIRILTYHDTTNYRAVLQAYALQNKINDFGYNCEIIDYKCDAITQRYKIKTIAQSENIKELIKSLFSNKDKRKLKENFDSFNRKYQKLSSRSYNKDNIKEAEQVYDKFITGSDQVWNLELSEDDTTYMLDFVEDKNKKESYAASFGYKTVPSKYSKETKTFLSSFDNILVREEQGKKIVKDLLNRESQVTIDPTLLLDSNEWDKLIANNNMKDYILLYIIAPNKDIIDFAKKLAKKENCKLIYINHSWKNMPGVKNLKSIGPEEFLSYIKYAKYVVTTSFHGVAFSINFNKQFFYALSNEKGNFNSRVENLVKKLNLEDRDIKNCLNEFKPINYDNVNALLDNEREVSTKLLKEILE